MNVNMRKSEKKSRNRTKSLIEKPQSARLSPRNHAKSEIYSFKSDVKQSEGTFRQKLINFFKRNFKRNIKHRKQNKYTNLKYKKIVNEKAEKSKPLSQPRSLKNIGSNCYLNAALQGISSCINFCQDISDLVTMYKNEIVNLRTFHDLLLHLNGGTFMSMEISKNKIFQNWNKSSQQDSFELLNYVLNEVYNEIREYEENRNRIEVNNYQQWLQIQLPMKIILNYTIRCDCGSIEYSPPQSDLAFHLVIYNTKHNTIQNAFENFFQDELIDCYKCNNIKCVNNKSYKCVKLQHPIPKTICIHLQKSHFNGTKMCKIKDKIGLNKLLTVKRSLFSVNEKNNLSKMENNESDLNTEKIIRSDNIQTSTKNAENISNKSTKITDNNNNNIMTSINFRKLIISDLRLRNSSFILSLTNISLLSSDREILKVDCKIGFDSIESDENGVQIIKEIDNNLLSQNSKLRDSEVKDFFKSSIDSNEKEENNDNYTVLMRQETRSPDCEKRKGIYFSGTFVDNKKNQNNEIIFSENLLNKNRLTSNPQNKNENHFNTYIVKDNTVQNTESNEIRSSENLLSGNCSNDNVEKKTDENNEIVSSENLVNENDITNYPQNINEIQIESCLNYKVIEDKTDLNGSNKSILSSENLLNENDIINDPQNKNEKLNANHSNENVVIDKTDENTQNNEIIYSENLLNANCSNNNIIDLKTDQNTEINEIICSENLLNKYVLTNNARIYNEIQNENHSNDNVVKDKTDENTPNNEINSSENLLNANCSDNNVVDLKTDQNTESNEIICSENFLNKYVLTNNARNNNEIQNENHSNDNVVKDKTDEKTQNNEIISSENLLYLNCSDKNVVDLKTDEKTENNEIISTENLLNANCLNNNEIQIENCSNDKIIEDRTDLNCSNNCSLSSENLLNESDLINDPQNKNETQNKKEEDNNTNNFLMRQETRLSDYEKQKGIHNSETSMIYIVDNKTNQNNEIISSENLLNENHLSNNPQNNNEIQIENCSNDNVQNKTEKDTQNIEIISSENLLNSNCSDDNVDLKTDQNTEINEIICLDNLLNNYVLTNNVRNNNEIQNENHSNDNVVKDKTDVNSKNNDLISSEKQVDESQEDETFSLKSIIVHLGSVNSGHYVCYKYFNNVWFLADDTRISKVTEEEVLRSDAYILFYEKN